jgi:hypothetical protein
MDAAPPPQSREPAPAADAAPRVDRVIETTTIAASTIEQVVTLVAPPDVMPPSLAPEPRAVDPPALNPPGRLEPDVGPPVVSTPPRIEPSAQTAHEAVPANVPVTSLVIGQVRVEVVGRPAPQPVLAREPVPPARAAARRSPAGRLSGIAPSVQRFGPSRF